MTKLRVIIPLICFVLADSTGGAPAPIRWAGQNVELVVSAVTERTARLELSPLDDRANPIPALPSQALVSFPLTEKLRARELAGEKELFVGRMRINLKPEPLTLSIRGADGKLVQELTFEGNMDGAVSFRTQAPVLGLGEGANQFDRRGTNYLMLNGQRAPFLMTHGGTIPVQAIVPPAGT